jgi:hypothetical protein
MSSLSWTKINRDRIIATHSDGFYVIKPEIIRVAVPISCDVCHLLMKTSDDSLAYRQYQCCSGCSSRWAESRRQEWKDGWRPSQEEIKIDLEVNRHPSKLLV